MIFIEGTLRPCGQMQVVKNPQGLENPQNFTETIQSNRFLNDLIYQKTFHYKIYFIFEETWRLNKNMKMKWNINKALVHSQANEKVFVLFKT